MMAAMVPWERAAGAIDSLPSPIREMVELSVETSMNAAEICGLARRRKIPDQDPEAVGRGGEA